MIKTSPDFISCSVETSLAFCIKCNFLSAPLHTICGKIRIIKKFKLNISHRIACLQVPVFSSNTHVLQHISHSRYFIADQLKTERKRQIICAEVTRFIYWVRLLFYPEVNAVSMHFRIIFGNNRRGS